MEKGTKLALGVAGVGFAVNRYMKSKEAKQPYLTQEQFQTKFFGGAATALGLATAGILEMTKNNPKARKVSFIALGGAVVGYYALIILALKKMS